MIKVAIAGADTPQAGELIRILAYHPEVKFTSLSAPGKEGVAVNSVHHGLIGDLDMTFSGPLPLVPDCSMLFVCGNSMTASAISALRMSHPDMRIIVVDPLPGLDTADFVYGLPEVNRKPLVRGATAARIPAAAASAVVVALFPLAVNMLLNDSLKVEVEAPEAYIAADRNRSAQEAGKVLNYSQSSFSPNMVFSFTPSEGPRDMTVRITLNCSVSLDQISDIYQMYDDHNFAYAVMSPVTPREVRGTNKCIVSVKKDSDSLLQLTVVVDPMMRGSAGEAVHNMNLLFGLHEKTGLALKAH